MIIYGITREVKKLKRSLGVIQILVAVVFIVSLIIGILYLMDKQSDRVVEAKEVEHNIPTEEVSTTPHVPMEVVEKLFTPFERRLLYSAVYAEGGSLSDKAQRLIAVVLIKRVLDSRYPNTVEEVIYQKKPTIQYECAINGALAKYRDIYEGNADYLTDEEFEDFERCAENVNWAIENHEKYPDNLLFQSRESQGVEYAVEDGEHFDLMVENGEE